MEDPTTSPITTPAQILPLNGRWEGGRFMLNLPSLAPAWLQPESRGQPEADRVGALRSHIKGPGAPGGIAFFFSCPHRSLQDVSFCNAVVCGVGGDGRRGDRSTEGTFSFKVSGCNRTSNRDSAGSERRSHRGGRGTPQEELGAHQLSSGSSQVHD
ncbi:hypothetical protein C7M84_003564 [Penaeus vannamei]|uniref:Uncharacterized protein n=1 Tax=Penaeus vannamei TaxID=6689 RepID=A0A423TMU3_PENVA|nr:hypothetical protein C7M84_003564 [Penaeus vannamei]